ncbi:MAG: hypothetical protein N3F03_09225 [Ignavibacteria bacterium]|nr:hypothetical protein [Ignavibacteria bacterium]
MKFEKYFLIFLLFQKIIFAQSNFTPDSIFKINSTTLRTYYNKILNLHNFNSILSSNYEFEKFSFSLNNRFNSNIISSTIKNIRDENYFDLKLDYKISSFLRPGILTETKRINDNRQIGISRFKDLSFKGLVTIIPYRQIVVTPFYGYKEEEQFEIKEKGNTYGLNSSFENDFSNSKLYGNLKLTNDKLDYRFNQLINSDFNLENSFSENFFTLTSINFNRISRDYFTSVDTSIAKLYGIKFNIEKREDDLIDFTQRIEIRNIENFEATIQGNIYHRNVQKFIRYKNLSEPTKNIFDTKVNEFKIGLSGETKFSFKHFITGFKFSYYERSEKHSIRRIPNVPDFLYYQRLDEELQKNNFSSRIILATQNIINLFSKDTIILDASISKLKYDTPPLENFTNPTNIIRDDRDELLYILRFQYIKVFNAKLISTLLLESFNNHIVYIFKERSSNNNWNRVLRLATQTNYENKNFTTKNQFEVLANYTVYDFEDLFQTTQSFAFRQFGFHDTSKIYFSENLSLNVNYHLKLSEQGIFYWRRFSSIPGRFLNEQAGEIKIGYDISKVSYLFIGTRFTSMSEFNYKGKMKQVVFEIKSFGPLIETYLFHRKDFYLNLKCWYEIIEQLNQPKRWNFNFSFNSQINI